MVACGVALQCLISIDTIVSANVLIRAAWEKFVSMVVMVQTDPARFDNEGVYGLSRCVACGLQAAASHAEPARVAAASKHQQASVSNLLLRLWTICSRGQAWRKTRSDKWTA